MYWVIDDAPNVQTVRGLGLGLGGCAVPSVCDAFLLNLQLATRPKEHVDTESTPAVARKPKCSGVRPMSGEYVYSRHLSLRKAGFVKVQRSSMEDSRADFSLSGCFSIRTWMPSSVYPSSFGVLHNLSPHGRASEIVSSVTLGLKND